jgi:Domain of unknown function (DUF4252)
MRLFIPSSFLFLLLAVPAWAGKPPEPGAIPLDDLNLFPREKLSVEINLEGPILRMVAAATSKDDPKFAQLMAGLKAIHVQVFPLKEGGGAALLRPKIDRMLGWLEDHGWHSIVRVRDKGDQSYIYLKEEDDQIVGLTVLALDSDDDAALINIVGRIDPAEIGRLGRDLDIPQLERIKPRSGDKP